MNTKQMILMEYLLDSSLNYGEYKIVFELNNRLYSGDFLQKNDDGDRFTRRYVEKPSRTGGSRAEIFIFKTKNGKSMEDQLIEDFRQYVRGNKIKQFSSLLAMKPNFLQKLIEFIPTIEPDEYLESSLEFPSVIYNFTDIETNKKLDFYLTNSEKILPVSLLII